MGGAGLLCARARAGSLQFRAAGVRALGLNALMRLQNPKT